MAELKQIKEINDLQSKLNSQLKEENAIEDKILTGRKKQLQIYNQIVDAGKEAVKNGKIGTAQLKGDLDLMNQLMGSDGDINELRKKRNNLLKHAERSSKLDLQQSTKRYQGRAKLVDLDMNRLKTQKISGELLGVADDLTGGLASKGLDVTKGIQKWGKGVGLASAGIAAAVMILISFSAKLDAIGAQFGAIGLQNREIKTDLLAAEQEAARLGKGMEDVLAATTGLTDEFGIGFSEARKTSLQVIDLGMAIGVGTDEAAKLIGNFKTLVGLSTEQAEALAKNVTLLAAASDVAPQAVLRDLASSSSQIALFTSDTGENIARGAIQARKLGLEFGTLADSAQGLVNYQETISNALDASILTGKQINTTKLMELSLAGDLEGLAQEQKKALGDENRWLKLNLIQREALAKAVGLTVDQAAKLITKQEEAVTLAGALAGQPGFDELIGTEGISTLTKMKGAFASIGALLTNSLGPALNVILIALNGIVGLVDLLLEASGINSLLRMAGGQGFSYTPGKSAARLKAGVMLQEGGIVTGPTTATIGEAGPEAVVPLDQFTRELGALKSEMSAVKNAISSLKLSTKITNKELSIVLSPQIG